MQFIHVKEKKKKWGNLDILWCSSTEITLNVMLFSNLSTKTLNFSKN